MENEVKTILISPHCDDIAFSIGGIIAIDFLKPPLEIVTVFSKSMYAPCLKENNLESVSKIRNLEENKYAEIIGAKIYSLQFPDSSLRGCQKHQLDAFKDFDELSDPIFVEVYNSLSNIMSEHPEADIICPLGIGNHIDHLLVFSICTRLCIENNRKITYYEDLPYAADLRLKEIRQRVDSLSKKYNFEIKPYKVNITDKLNYKVRNLRMYKSQICNEKDIFKIKVHSTRIGIKPENLMDFVWQFSALRHIFKKYYIRRDLKSYERIWKVNQNFKQ